MTRCKHYICRCARAEELMQMNRPAEAVDVHRLNEEVRCRTCCPSCGAADTGGAVCTPCHVFNRDAFRPAPCT